MANYPTQLDEIDQWLFDSFGIVAGACSSTENLRYNTAKMIAEVLWPKCKDSLHIPETCKENGKTVTDESGDLKEGETVTICHQLKEGETVTDCNELEEEVTRYLREKCSADDEPSVSEIARHFASWQKEQDHYACRQCEKAYDNVFYKGVQQAIKMLKEEAIGGTVCGRVIDHINIRFAEGVGKYLEPKDISHIPADKSKYNIGDKVKVIILKDE